MFNRFLWILFFVFPLIAQGCGKNSGSGYKPPEIEKPAPTTEEQKIMQTKWDSVKVSDAVIWKYYHFQDIFSSKQSVTVFDINLNVSNLKIDIPYVSQGFLKTSDAGASVKATAAINGSYFNTETGGSTVFFKKNGSVITTTRTGFTTYRENAAITIDQNRKVSIISKPSGGWEASISQTLLASGPLLLMDGKQVDQVNQAFNTNRHPRTAVGITKDNHLICLVVDGRTSESYGLTTTELSIFMKALGCKSAMNLDGGGSSTAWLRNRGVVSYPSDNGKFDHEGERGVATVIAFIEE